MKTKMVQMAVLVDLEVPATFNDEDFCKYYKELNLSFWDRDNDVSWHDCQVTLTDTRVLDVER